MRQRSIRLLAAALVCASAFAQSEPTTSVTGGKIRGRAVDRGAVFKGIPFAAPPEGQLRWKPPMPVKPWTGVRDAGEYSATCAQIDAGWNKTSAAAGKEDCLYLNVWTPEWPSRGKKAVMFWIHGGANMGGSALGAGGIEPPFDGGSLAGHGVVVVTINYRLGLLGFLAHPEMTAESPHRASGNYGLLDILAALQWVKQNIDAFGGDAAKVTVFGQSAGASNTAMMLVSPLSQGLLARAIEQSGTVIMGGRLTSTLDEAEKRGLEFAAKMNAPASGALAYMRSLPAAEVLKASPRYGAGGVGPIVDGYVITAVPGKSFAQGREHRLPLMIGSNARERSIEGGEDALRKAVGEFYKDMAPRALALYSSAPAYAPYGDAGAQFLTDTFARCPAATIAEFHSRAGNPAWEYEFSHAFPEATNGAVHSGELRYLFGVFPPALWRRRNAEFRTRSRLIGPTSPRPAIPMAKASLAGRDSTRRRGGIWSSPMAGPWRRRTCAAPSANSGPNF